MNKDLKITIEGSCNSGKTTVVEVISKALKDCGANLTIKDDFENSNHSKLNFAKEILLNKNITIEVIQTIRKNI